MLKTFPIIEFIHGCTDFDYYVRISFRAQSLRENKTLRVRSETTTGRRTGCTRHRRRRREGSIPLRPRLHGAIRRDDVTVCVRVVSPVRTTAACKVPKPCHADTGNGAAARTVHTRIKNECVSYGKGPIEDDLPSAFTAERAPREACVVDVKTRIAGVVFSVYAWLSCRITVRARRDANAEP